MKRKERFLTALKAQEPDRVPMFDFLFQQPMYETLIGHRPGGYNGRDAVECALALDHDGVWLPFGGFSGYQPQYLSENVYKDEWGTVYQKNEASWPIDAPIDYPIKTRADLKNYNPPDPTLPGRTAEIEAAREMDNDDIALLGGVQAPLTTTWLLMGYENISYALYDDPQLLAEVFQISNEFFKEAARRSVEAGCVGMWLSEDLGDSTRGFFRLEHFRRYLLPHFKIAAIHPLQRTAGMDLRTVKEKYGKQWCIIGNIDSSRTLPFGTPTDVAAEVKEAIDIAAPGGGYILASDHSLHDGIPVENIVEMFRTGREYGSEVYKS
jgi:uroporphyrinogen decarboxylase